MDHSPIICVICDKPHKDPDYVKELNSMLPTYLEPTYYRQYNPGKAQDLTVMIKDTIHFCSCKCGNDWYIEYGGLTGEIDV